MLIFANQTQSDATWPILSITLTGFAVAGAVEVSCSPGSLGAQLRETKWCGRPCSKWQNRRFGPLFHCRQPAFAAQPRSVVGIHSCLRRRTSAQAHTVSGGYRACRLLYGCASGERCVSRGNHHSADGAFADGRLRSVVLDTHTRATGFGVFASCIQLCEADFAEGAARRLCIRPAVWRWRRPL